MPSRIALTLALAAIGARCRSVTGAQSAADNPSRPIRAAGRHRRPKAYVRAATAVRDTVARAWPTKDPRPHGRHRRRRRTSTGWG